MSTPSQPHRIPSVPLGAVMLGLVIALAWMTVAPTALGARPWPTTSRGVHVFNDQISPELSDVQIRFAARNYDGAQKLLRSDADRLRAVNSRFLVLHYRLGIGLGYRTVTDGCQPTGEPISVIEGNEWVQEWPQEVNPIWFFGYGARSRVLNCDWGWYLADLDNPRWRDYWLGEVTRQLRANDDDGVFMDSLSVPNYLGASSFDPPLPDLDDEFEGAWSTRIDRWLDWLRSRLGGRYYLVPNAGSWITSRDRTTYSGADGVMIEGFALEADRSPYALEDWKLQASRVLGAVARNQAVIAQTYATGKRERMFATGSYLLVKGSRTFLNIDSGTDPEWWPEYDITIGGPRESAGTDIERLYDRAAGVYRRRFSGGEVLVNPTSPYDGTGRTATVRLERPSRLARTRGGGTVGPSGRKRGAVTYRVVRQVRLPPYSAAILLKLAARADDRRGRDLTDMTKRSE